MRRFCKEFERRENMKNKTRRLTATALMAALTLILGLTPVGYIPIPPVTMTLMCIPVIIGTITQGLSSGIVLGLIFGVTSLLKALGISLVPDAFGMWLLSGYPLIAILTIFIPRLLIPVVTYAVYRLIARGQEAGARQKVSVGIAAFAGSITNTVLFLGFLYIFMMPYADALAEALGVTKPALFGTIAGIGAINGLPEAAVAVLLCMPILYAVQKIKKKD